MQSLAQLSRRFLKRQWKRTILTAVSIVMATALFAGVGLLFTSLIESFIVTEEQESGYWHYHVSGLTLEQARQIQANIRIEASGLVMVSGRFARMPEQADDGPESQPRWLIMRDASSLPDGLTPYRLMSGRFPGQEGELALDPLAAALLGGVEPGDSVTLELEQRFPDTSAQSLERTFTVVGLFAWMDSALPADVYHALTVVPPDEQQAGELYLTVRPSSRYEDQLFAALSDTIPGADQPDRRWQSKYEAPETGRLHVRTHEGLLRYYGQTSHDATNRVMLGVFALLSAIIMVSVVFVIRNSFSMSVTERLSEFGLLRVVGATPGQIRRLVLQDAWQLALAGIPLGLLAGLGAMAVTIGAVAKVDLPVVRNMRLVMSPAALLLAAGMSLVTIFLAAFSPALRSSRQAPVEAIRHSGTFRVKSSSRRIHRGRLGQWLLGAPGALASRNVRRDRRRFRTTALSVAVSAILFLAAGGLSLQMRASLAAFNSEQTDFTVHAARSDQFDCAPELVHLHETLSTQPEVARSALLGRFYASAPLDPGQLDAGWVEAYRQQSSIYGRELTPEQAAADMLYNGLLTVEIVLADRSLLDELGVSNPNQAWQAMKNGQALLSQTGSLRIGPVGGATVPLTTLGPGDAFPLRDTTRDDQDGHKTVILDLPDHLQIASEIEDQPWFVAGAFSGVPTVRLIVSQGYASRHFAVLPSFDQGIAWQLLLDAQPGQEKALQIMLAGQLTGREGEALSLEDNYANLQMARDLVFVMDVFLYGFTVVIILICAMNIINIVTTQIVLRRRELAMLRAIGMSGAQQTIMLLAESALYGLTGALWGSAAGLALLAALSRQTDQLLAGSGLRGVPWLLVLWTLAGALLLSLLAGILPIRRVRRDSIVDAIREEG